ncbi:VaFE repeat-containing surface-anchored protein [Erysipelothrix sp. HDW6B]|uniref:SpaA isopeptide-forming pilin-related protein n=1 Tax=Erysipelothrix sp. HDW6B TaxID=2714929 RepID=UPI00140C0349|nr:SpaA isopeptide-forming pilin-related protein [Erysipelothrix sp. HDW6B]QIK86615.1 VaFE repeat-containing surface-anchored protein [Erysipelothrix sp. HDW6B]
MKKLNRKLTTFIMTLLLSITTLIQATPVLANSIHITTQPSGIISTGYYEAVNSRGWAVQRKSGHNSNIIYVNGVIAFCIEPEIQRGDGDGYTVSDFTHDEREIFSRIIYHGYDNTTKTGKDYVVTQNVLWEYIASIRNDLDINGSWGFEGFDYQSEKQTVWNKVNSHNDRASFHNTTVKLKTGESITLTDTNGAISQSSVSGNGGLDVSISGNKMSLTANPSSPEKTKIEFKKYGNIPNNASSSPLLYSHPNMQDVIVGGNPDPIPFYVNVEVEHKGTLQIGKVNAETKAPVPNTTFELSLHEDMGNATRYTTGTNGFTDNIELDAGTYYYREVAVPEPLIVDRTFRKVEIKAGQRTEVSVSNEVAKGRIVLEKKDSETGDLLQNAEYTVYSDKALTKIVAILTTDVNGLAESRTLPLGPYYIKETKATVGYLVNENVYTVNLNYQDQNTKIVIENLGVQDQVIKGKIQIVKVEQDQQTPIQGAVFTVKDINGNLIEEITTDENGFAFTNDLRYGQYFIQEKSTPFEFWIDKTIYPISILENGVTLVKYIPNKSIEIKLQIFKTDIETGTPLSGAIFEIHDTNNNVVSFDYLDDTNQVVTQTQLVTDSNGMALTRGFLKVGTYRLVELQAPKGYLKSAPIEFTVDQSTEYVDLPVIGYTTTQTIGNQPTQIEVIKLSENTGQPVSGATLQLIHKVSGKLIQEWISGDEPILFKGLEIGESYIIKEVSAPSGYLLAEPLEFTVQETNELQSVVVLNELEPEIKTQAFYESGNKESQVSESMTVIDRVTYKNLIVGKEYTLKGTLLTTDTQDIVAESDISFIPECPDGSIDITFTFDGSTLLGKELVVFEDLYHGTRQVATHTDITNQDQTVNIPSIDTQVSLKKLDPSNPNHLSLIDVVYYKQLTIGQTYRVKGWVMDKQTGLPLLVDNKEISSELDFTPKSKSGTLEMKFELDLSTLSKSDYVVFEEIYLGDELIAEHKDINDKNQTFSLVEVIVHKVDSKNNQSLSGAEFTLFDEVNQPISQRTTDEQGLARFLIPTGTYILKETQSPKGYRLDNTERTLKLIGNELDHEIKLVIKNEKIPKLPNTGVSTLNPILLYGLLGIGSSLLIVSTIMKKKESNHETLED